MKKQVKKIPYCAKQKKFYGVITITEKGQISIPIDIRRDLNIKEGEKLFIIKRGDNNGINLIKATAFEDFMNKMSIN